MQRLSTHHAVMRLFLLLLAMLPLLPGLPGCCKKKTGDMEPFTVDVDVQTDFLSGSWRVELTDITGNCAGHTLTLDDETMNSLIQQDGRTVFISELFESEEPGIFDGRTISFDFDVPQDGEEPCTFHVEALFTITDENHFSGTVTEIEPCPETPCTWTYTVTAIRRGTFMTGRWALTIEGNETCTDQNGSSESSYTDNVVIDIVHEDNDVLTIAYVSGDEIPELSGMVMGDLILLSAFPFEGESDIVLTLSADRDSFSGTDSYTESGDGWTCEGGAVITGVRQ